MDKKELAAMVAQILNTMEPMVKGSDYKPTVPGPQPRPGDHEAGDFVPDITKLDLRKLYLTEDAKDSEGFGRSPAGQESAPSSGGILRSPWHPRSDTAFEGPVS